MKNELIVTDTNSGKDSKGEFLGLEGKLYLPACISLLISLSVYFLIFYFNLFHTASIPIKFILSALPLVGTVTYLILFVHRKPPNYKSDLWRVLTKGSDFNHYPSYISKKRHILNHDENS